MDLKNFWQGLRYIKKGLLLGIIFLLLYIIYLTISGTHKPQLTCIGGAAGAPPPLGARQCSTIDYLISSLNLYTIAFAILIVLIPILIGYLIDKSKIK